MGIFRKTKRDPELQSAAEQPRPDLDVKRRRRRRLLGGAYTGGGSGS
ncbi:hypothetical protein [Nocardia salmonicida]|nr:hypothetical protein [Nocardia salmonicida]